MQPSTLRPLLLLCTLLAVEAAPQGGKKIVFSTVTKLDSSQIKYSTETLTPGTPEYYQSHQLVAVTSDGYEYEGTLEDVMESMKIQSSVRDPGMPSNPHPLDSTSPHHFTETHAPGPDPLASQTEDDLSKALDNLEQAAAEKRSVIGTDTRVKVEPPNRFPYTAMGRIEYGCTGTFIAARTMLTAAHCVYNTRQNRWVSNLNVKRGKGCDPDDGTRHTWKRAITYKGWTENHSWEYDIAIIIFNEPSPVFMNYQSYNSITLETINIAGYPADKRGKCLYRTHCVLGEVLEKRLRYPCDTFGGNSGSAVYKYWSGTNTRIIIGVHAYGAGGTPRMNSGTRMTHYYRRTIAQAIVSNGGN